MADIMKYFQVDGFSVLFGSLTVETRDQQLFWFKLMSLCSISRVYGIVCLDDHTPYPLSKLANMLGFTEEETRLLLDYEQVKPQERIKILDWGGIQLLNWEEQQSNEYRSKRLARERQRRHREGQEKDPVTHDVTHPCHAPVTPCHAADKNRIEKKRREDVEDGGDSAATLRSRSRETQDQKDQEFKTQFHVEWEDWVIRKTQVNPEKRDLKRAHKMLDAFIARSGLYPVNRLFNALAGRGMHSLDEFFTAVKKLPDLKEEK